MNLNLRLRDLRNSRKQGAGSCLTSVLKRKIEDLLKLVRIWLISRDSHQVSVNWVNFAIFAVRSWCTLKEQGLGEISDNHADFTSFAIVIGELSEFCAICCDI